MFQKDVKLQQKKLYGRRIVIHLLKLKHASNFYAYQWLETTALHDIFTIFHDFILHDVPHLSNPSCQVKIIREQKRNIVPKQAGANPDFFVLKKSLSLSLCNMLSLFSSQCVSLFLTFSVILFLLIC